MDGSLMGRDGHRPGSAKGHEASCVRASVRSDCIVGKSQSVIEKLACPDCVLFFARIC